MSKTVNASQQSVSLHFKDLVTRNKDSKETLCFLEKIKQQKHNQFWLDERAPFQILYKAEK